MKLFLMSTQNVFKSQKINETKGLDNRILAHLNASPTSERTWYNAFMLFLFPRDRRFYQYPGLQLAVATVLIFGVFNLINFSGLKGDSSIAFEEVSDTKEELIIQKKTSVIEGKSEIEELEMMVYDVLVDSVMLIPLVKEDGYFNESGVDYAVSDAENNMSNKDLDNSNNGLTFTYDNFESADMADEKLFMAPKVNNVEPLQEIDQSKNVNSSIVLPAYNFFCISV